MKYRLSFEIECGSKTCALSPGKFCKFLKSAGNGKCTCYFFGTLFDQYGWIQRHKDCLNNGILEKEDDQTTCYKS